MMRNIRSFALVGILAVCLAHFNFAESPAPIRAATLTVVPEPKGERLSPDYTAGRTPLEPPFSTSIGGRTLSIRYIDTDEDGNILIATTNGRKVWGIGYLSAGGSESSFYTYPGLNILVGKQSRRGIVIIDLESGKELADGGDLTVSPNGKWTIVPPWFSWQSECFTDTRTFRITIQGRVETKVVDTMDKKESCPGVDSQKSGVTAAAVSRDGKLYAMVRARRSYETGKTEDGLIKLFNSSDDKEIASLRTSFPRDFHALSFTMSGKYLVLEDSMEEAKIKKDLWLRITQ